MSPKKAIIILTLAALTVAVIFAVFYFLNQKEEQDADIQKSFLPSAKTKGLTPEELQQAFKKVSEQERTPLTNEEIEEAFKKVSEQERTPLTNEEIEEAIKR